MQHQNTHTKIFWYLNGKTKQNKKKNKQKNNKKNKTQSMVTTFYKHNDVGNFTSF